MAETYSLFVDEKDLDGEATERRILGEFASEAEAVDAARAVIDDFLMDVYDPGMEAQELFDAYAAAGPEPLVPGSSFKAWDYAIEHCKEICDREDW
jgi:hypothetical protein